jgi:hypothetical protein
MKTSFRLFLIALLALNLFSCKVNEEKRVKKVATDFLTLLNKKDYEKASDMGTKSTRQMLDMMESFAGLEPDTATIRPMKIEFLTCDIRDDKARVSYRNYDKEESLELKKVKGKWLVDMKKEDSFGKDAKKTATEDSIKAAEAAVEDSISMTQNHLSEVPDTTTYFDFCLTGMNNNPNKSASLMLMLNNCSEYDVTHLWLSLYISDTNGVFLQKKDVMFDNLPKPLRSEEDTVITGNTQKTEIVLDKANINNIGEIYMFPLRFEMKPVFDDYDYRYGGAFEYLKEYTKIKNTSGSKVKITF